MELDARFAGTPLKEYRTTVTWRDTMNFAAALGDRNAYYFDDERDGGIVAPPLFTVSLTWPVCERLWDYIEAEHFPVDLLATQVHYTEHLQFHRSLIPGDRPAIRGKIAAILPHRAGTHVILRFDAYDDGERPLFTEHIGALLRGVRCMNGPRGQEALPPLPSLPDDNPRPLWETILPIDPLQPFIYDGCSRIFFPIHTSKQFARQVGLPGIILQGTATLAYAAREIINREAGGDPRRLKSISCRFTGMVLPGTAINVAASGGAVAHDCGNVFFVVRNSDGKQAISDGTASITTTGRENPAVHSRPIT